MKFNAQKTVNEITEFIQNYFQNNHLKGTVIGVSGGKDSAVVLGLFTRALGHENVVGLWLPCNSKETDKKDAQLLCKNLNVELKEFDLTSIYTSFVSQIKSNNQVNDNDLIDSNINLQPRLRMMSLYYYAAMLSKINNGPYIVAGTSNKCERFVGYFTKGGDNVCDISVLGELTVSEVIKIGEYLELPYQIVHKTPDDGLSGKTDEEKLGVTYMDIEKYIHEEETGEKEDIPFEIREKIKRHHERNSHKFNIPTYRSKK